MRFAYGRALPMPFAALRLNASLLKALAEEGYRTPTPIQERTIPPALEGRDVLGCASPVPPARLGQARLRYRWSL
jgi:superfamily II DNA/RNA helicase